MLFHQSLDRISGPGRQLRRKLWFLVRPFVPAYRRFLFEGNPALPGQLWVADRDLIYRTVRERRPAAAFEIGTHSGGGSTFFVASALAANGDGILHSIEIERGLLALAQERYAKYAPQLLEHLRLYLGDYRDVFRPVLEETGVDFFVLDGSDEPAETEEQFRFFDAYAKTGCTVVAHDWFDRKCSILRPLLESSDDWTLARVIGPPASVGVALAVKR